MNSTMENQELKTEMRKMPLFFLVYFDELLIIAKALKEKGVSTNDFVELLRRSYDEQRKNIHGAMLARMNESNMVSEEKSVDTNLILKESLRQVWREISPLLEGDLLEIPQIMEIVNPT